MGILNKLFLIPIIVVVLFACWAVSANAEKIGYDMFPSKEGNYKTFKVFDDGIMYKTYLKGWGIEEVNILYNGTEYECQPDGYHYNQYLNPICVEIIMRSLP